MSERKKQGPANSYWWRLVAWSFRNQLPYKTFHPLVKKYHFGFLFLLTKERVSSFNAELITSFWSESQWITRMMTSASWDLSLSSKEYCSLNLLREHTTEVVTHAVVYSQWRILIKVDHIELYRCLVHVCLQKLVFRFPGVYGEDREFRCGTWWLLGLSSHLAGFQFGIMLILVQHRDLLKETNDAELIYWLFNWHQ